MYYIIDGERYNSAEDLVEDYLDSTMFDPDDEETEEYINEIYDKVEVCGRNFYPGEIVKVLDDDWFNDFRNDLSENRLEDEKEKWIDEIEKLEDREDVYVEPLGLTVYAYEENEENEENNEDEEEYLEIDNDAIFGKKPKESKTKIELCQLFENSETTKVIIN